MARPKDPEFYPDENMLLASMISSEEFFKAMLGIGVDHKYFRDPDLQDLCLCLIETARSASHRDFSQRMLGGHALKDKYRIAISHDASKYLDLYRSNDAYRIDAMFADEVDQRNEDYERQVFAQAAEMFQHGRPLSEVAGKIEQTLAMGGEGRGGNMWEVSELCRMESMEEHFPIGIEEFDSKVRIQPSHLVLLGGQSSTGKTTLANQMVTHWMENAKHGCLYFSLETRKRRLGNRIARHVMRKHHLTRDEALAHMAEWGERLVIYDDVVVLDDIIGAVSRAASHGRLKFVVVDYQQDVEVPRLESNETERTSKVAVALHRLAVKHNLVVILLSQLRKKIVENGRRDSGPPTLDDFRGAGQTGNKADTAIINWFRESPCNDDGPRPLTMQIVKQKEGSQGHVDMFFHGKHFTFAKTRDLF